MSPLISNLYDNNSHQLKKIERHVRCIFNRNLHISICRLAIAFKHSHFISLKKNECVEINEIANCFAKWLMLF